MCSKNEEDSKSDFLSLKTLKSPRHAKPELRQHRPRRRHNSVKEALGSGFDDQGRESVLGAGILVDIIHDFLTGHLSRLDFRKMAGCHFGRRPTPFQNEFLQPSAMMILHHHHHRSFTTLIEAFPKLSVYWDTLSQESLELVKSKWQWVKNTGYRG